MTIPSTPSETYGNFDLVTKTKLDFTDVLVSKYRSRVTGLSVIHLDYEGVYLQVWKDQNASVNKRGH